MKNKLINKIASKTMLADTGYSSSVALALSAISQSFSNLNTTISVQYYIG